MVVSSRNNSSSSSSSSSSLGPKALFESLCRTWRPRRQRQHPAAWRLGLAISGGSDSMALAALCAEIQQRPWRIEGEKFEGRFSFKAFVVDHQARSGSGAEAEKVRSILEGRGISTEILRLRWPDCRPPSEHRNFETLARSLRYQALGRACRDRGMEHLLVAHHQDDQVETVLWRMANGHRGVGLRGMKAAAQIPECYGIHGVYESGAHDALKSEDFDTSEEDTKPDLLGHLSSESGGVQVLRPLLDFSKEDLLQVCEELNMSWVEDSSNVDETLTGRNAIRYIIRNHQLPRALTKPSILRLSSVITAKYATITEKANNSFSEALKLFEPQVGSLEVSFKALNTSDPREDRCLAAHVLSRAIQMVSPSHHINTKALAHARDVIFPSLSVDSEYDTNKTFTTANCQFTYVGPSSAGSQWGDWWRISRQPHHRNLESSTVLHFPPDLNSGSSGSGCLPGQFSEWKLYDGRYWIRIKNLSDGVVSLRQFSKESSADFWDSLSGQEEEEELKKTVRAIAPGNIRWTLPAITTGDEMGFDRVLALPTLGVGTELSKTLIEWEVRNKRLKFV